MWAQTGMRAGEVAGLRWGDVDFERGTAVVQRTVLLALRRLPVQALDPEAYVFTWQGSNPWHPMAILRAWKRALKGAGVRYRSPEQLRHTFASLLLSRNAP